MGFKERAQEIKVAMDPTPRGHFRRYFGVYPHDPEASQRVVENIDAAVQGAERMRNLVEYYPEYQAAWAKIINMTAIALKFGLQTSEDK